MVTIIEPNKSGIEAAAISGRADQSEISLRNHTTSISSISIDSVIHTRRLVQTLALFLNPSHPLLGIPKSSPNSSTVTYPATLSSQLLVPPPAAPTYYPANISSSNKSSRCYTAPVVPRMANDRISRPKIRQPMPPLLEPR